MVRHPALVVLTLIAVTGCSSSRGRDPAHDIAVAVSVDSCGQGWTSGRAGEQDFVLHNTDTRAGDVDLVAAAGGAVYAEVEPLAPGTSVTLHARLGAGRYAFRCSMEDEPSVTGAPVTLTGAARGDTPAVAAVSQADLIPAVKAYEDYVISRLPGLVRSTGVIERAVDSADLAAARRDWVPAHLAYVRLGAAYGAFGDLDTDIDGTSTGLPEGVRDPAWHGFHRLEYGLWHHQAAATLRPIAATLMSDVQRLARTFATSQVTPLDIGVRAHEITEDALGIVLTGRDDYGSHTELATVRTDVDSTRIVLGAVRAVLAPRYRGIGEVDRELRRAAADLDALRRPGGTWPTLTGLPRRAHERVDADISELAEVLAPVATILEPRRTS